MEVKQKPSIKIEIKTPGDGKTFPKPGNTVTVHYHGYQILEQEELKKKKGKKEENEVFDSSVKKEVFDSSVMRKEPFSYMFGANMVVRGFDDAVAQMSVGEKVFLTCPPEFAYGKAGVRKIIKPDKTVFFEIELLKVED